MGKTPTKSYLRSLQKVAMFLDKMPPKKIKKWKRKERQRAKKEIRDALRK